jgi:hypothetical protein
MLKRGLVLTAIAALLLTSVPFIAYGDGGNILKNPGFEELNGQLAANWSPDVFDKKPDAGKISVEEGKGLNNSKALVVNNIKLNDSKVFQEVQVQPNKIYKVSCWIKTEGILNKAGSANLTLLNGKGVHTSAEYEDTKNDWKELLFYIRMTDSDNLKIGCRLGGFGTTNQGIAYFDDISVELVNEVPEGTFAKDFFIPGSSSTSANDTTTQESKSGSNKIVLIIIAIVAVVGALIFLEIKYSKKVSKNNTAENDGESDSKKDSGKDDKAAEESEEEDFEEEDYDE